MRLGEEDLFEEMKVIEVMCITTVELMIQQTEGRQRLFISQKGCTGVQAGSWNRLAPDSPICRHTHVEPCSHQSANPGAAPWGNSHMAELGEIR